jgi:hypothetical protein
MNPLPRLRLIAVLLMSSSLSPLAACTDAGSRADTGASPAGAALNFDRLRCASRTGRRTCERYNASVAELIANPRDFHGKPVRVIGYAHVEAEANALYVGETDYAHAIHRNGLWLNAPPGADSLSDAYVLVEATFDASSQGEFAGWSGTLKDVTRMARGTGRADRRDGDSTPPAGSRPPRSP